MNEPCTVCDRCACELKLDEVLTGPNGETLCGSCACEVADEEEEG